jgi:hypothetical protein
VARTKGAQNKITIAVKDAVEHAFRKKNQQGYLLWLADEHPSVFCALVAKCIPTQLAVDVNHHALNLGVEMARASERLARLNAAPILEHIVTPDTPSPGTPDPPQPDTPQPDTSQPDTVSGDT